MPDCSLCNRPLGVYRQRCRKCGACEMCCECDSGADLSSFDADELGIDPELDAHKIEARNNA